MSKRPHDLCTYVLKSSTSKAEAEPVVDASYGYVKLLLMSATFASRPKLPCHFTEVRSIAPYSQDHSHFPHLSCF